MPSSTIISTVKALLAEQVTGRGLGVLSSVTPEGKPHSAWMGTIAESASDRILTLTGSQSRKVQNIRGNPQVEWMFASAEMKAVLYLRGSARLISETAELKKAWNQLSDKSRAYFLPYQTNGLGFVVIETKIESLEYVVPTQNLAVILTPDDLK